EAGIIRCISKDVSRIYPRDFSVVEVEITPENQDVDIMGGWVFKDGKIQPREYSQEELIARAEAKKAELLSLATAAILPLQDAFDLGVTTEEETALLLEWKKYRVQVNRVDTSTAPGINWPSRS
ncbi:TPA: tail fiber assembly protein, partial [Citrobacter koseri]|nr:tail fiber assembly protein [Citrobacter koseri]